MTNLLDLAPGALKGYFADRGEKPFHARQVSRWIHQRFVADFGAMSDLPRALRERLADEAEVRGPAVVRDTTAADGTRKWLLDAGNGNAVESVYIPEDDRGTLCVSSQAGCALDCAFCSTGKQGFNRNLTVAEIVGQLWHANRALLADGVTAPWVEAGRAPITNVVMMGMGEPLANFAEVARALRTITSDRGLGISPRRVTVSTSGLVPEIDKLGASGLKVNLAVSLNATTDAVRDRIMPVNKRYPIRELLAACRRFPLEPRRRITFEYVLLKKVNDSPEDALRLAKLLRGIKCKVNLIPFNPFPGSGFQRPDDAAVRRFQQVLLDHHYTAPVRESRGRDISAACGQLRERAAAS